MTSMKYIKISHLAFLAVVAFTFSACEEDKDPVKEEFKLPSLEIRKIEIDDDGVKWIATAKGVVKMDDKEWTVFKDNELLTQTPVDELAFSNVSGTRELWIGSSKGVSWFDYTAESINEMTTYRAQQDGLLDDQVSAIDIDGQNVKYIGTSKGLSILKGTQWDQFMGRQNEEILAEYPISAIATAANGRIYASTVGGGVSSFKYTDAVTGATTFHQPWSADLLSDTVYTVIVVDDNDQWYGTNRGAALHTSEFAKANWTSYTRLNGLICDSVYAIGKDSKGQIWFGTHKGVSMLKDTIWQTFTTKEGLIDNKINTLAVDKDGSVWFGTDKGISHYSNGHWVSY